MAAINFNVPNDKIQRIIDAMVGMFPIPLEIIEDVSVPLFTPQQWAKEAVRRFIVKTVSRWEKKQASDEAMANIPIDDNLLT